MIVPLDGLAMQMMRLRMPREDMTKLLRLPLELVNCFVRMKIILLMLRDKTRYMSLRPALIIAIRLMQCMMAVACVVAVPNPKHRVVGVPKHNVVTHAHHDAHLDDPNHHFRITCLREIHASNDDK